MIDRSAVLAPQRTRTASFIRLNKRQVVNALSAVFGAPLDRVFSLHPNSGTNKETEQTIPTSSPEYRRDDGSLIREP